jgi:hypothetical protein
MTSRYQISFVLRLEMSQEFISGEQPDAESFGEKGRCSLKEVNEENTLMKEIIDEVIFKMQDGRKVKVSEYGGSWTQYGVTKEEMLKPRFLDEFWKLLLEWQIVDID